MESSSNSELRAALLKVPYQSRWDLLKPTIKRLYIDEGRHLSDVAEIIKRDYKFEAFEDGYKYYVSKKWKLRKNIPAFRKTAILQSLETRASVGTALVVKYKGEPVNPTKLRRHCKLITRNDVSHKAMNAVSTLGSGRASYVLHPSVSKILLSWNVPYGLFQKLESSTVLPTSPMAIDLSALSDVEMFSNSDRDAGSKSDVNSKLAVALSQRKAMKRAQLFLRGEFGELLRSMHSEDKRIMSTWLYQYWRFSHRTAKGWGRPSANWAPGLLALNIDKDKDNNSPISSRVIEDLDVPLSESTSFRTGPPEAMPVPTASNPTALCYWTVHKWFTGTEYDVTDAAPQFREILITALESGDFSDIRSTSLPVALPQVLKSAERTPNALSRECLGFAVMGRDEDLVKSCLLDEELDADDLIPLYLAISYLDGARTCCNILGPIVSSIFSKNELSGETGHTNDLGHTFLDSLMIEILSSHTSLKTKEIDSSWDQDTRFTGQEVDICGRWDADSDCILALYAQGRTAIPFSWKHKFCHTSAQAICHCISTFHELAPCGDINTVSGLFLKHCSYCGLKMKLYPLHTLVVTAFFLVQRGCEDEDLFGILAYLLSMLSTDVNPLWTAEVSLAALQINDDTGQCDHEHLDALCFAKKIESIYSNTWTEETSTSWHIFCYVLNSSIHEWTEVAKISLCNHCRSESDCDFYNKTSEFDIFDVCSKEVLWELEDFPWAAFECDGENCQSVNFFSGNKTLGTLLAAVQIELLTYRRQKDGDPWTSGNFNMQDLLESLETRNEVGVKLVQDQMMKPFCKCGTFRRGMPECPRAADACAFHFSNLEDPGCEKVTYVDMPRR